MTGRVMIVTGGNSGIGYEVARYLCEGGNDVVIASRDKEKGAEAVYRIKRDLPNSLVQTMELDLASQSSIREFVKEFTKKKRKLNVLINNAGMALNFKDLTRRANTDGCELTMATNHLGPFLLTNLLLDYLIQTGNIMGDSRIINVTCAIHDHENNWSSRGCDYLAADNLQLQKEGTYSGVQAYKNSKLCNIFMAYYLADKLSGTDVTCNAIDPGSVQNTGLMRHANKVQQTFSMCCIHNVMRPITHNSKTAKEAAQQIVDLAISDKFEGKNGKFFRDGVEDRSSVESYDKDTQKQVWKVSANLVNINKFADEGFDDISLN